MSRHSPSGANEVAKKFILTVYFVVRSFSSCLWDLRMCLQPNFCFHYSIKYDILNFFHADGQFVNFG